MADLKGKLWQAAEDAINGAETPDEMQRAFVRAFDLVDEERQPLLLALMQESDSRNDEIITRETLKPHGEGKMS